MTILFGCQQIPDDYTGFPKESFCIPTHFIDCIQSVLIPGGVISDRSVCCVNVERLSHALPAFHD